MKYLTTDEQTVSDLAIFSRPGKASIYDIFNKTRTHGGGRLLEEFFRQPLSDAAGIHKRVETFRFFSSRKFDFPADAESVGALEYYLQNEDTRTQIGSEQSLGRAIQNIITNDHETVFINNGVHAVLRLLKQTIEFIDEIKDELAGNIYEEEFTELIKIVYASRITELRIYATEKNITKIPIAKLAGFDKLIRFEERKLFLNLLNCLYKLDVCIAVGRVARERKFQFAVVHHADVHVLKVHQVYHPHVEGAVPNDFLLDGNNNVFFLTGANMAGKSTLMKSIGVALYLAHMGFPVAAAHLEFSVRDAIYSSINLADNLKAGASHYYAEVLRVKEVVAQLRDGKKVFAIFDELFRGTNVKDAYDATIALTTSFCGCTTSQFIISTHIMEAGSVLQERKLPVRFQYLPTVMDGKRPVYTRKLKTGITSDRQGMLIVKNEGILELLDAGIKKKEKKYAVHNR